MLFRSRALLNTSFKPQYGIGTDETSMLQGEDGTLLFRTCGADFKQLARQKGLQPAMEPEDQSMWGLCLTSQERPTTNGTWWELRGRNCISSRDFQIKLGRQGHLSYTTDRMTVQGRCFIGCLERASRYYQLFEKSRIHKTLICPRVYKSVYTK